MNDILDLLDDTKPTRRIGGGGGAAAAREEEKKDDDFTFWMHLSKFFCFCNFLNHIELAQWHD